ncbi:MAG: hypothetical protein EPO61_00115 [Nitrospirae bacterium]|nr:MAG: hypothetical protein EPO61_00115 [Nitrospirota bacterium]
MIPLSLRLLAALGAIGLALSLLVVSASAEEVATPSPSKFQFEGKVSSWLSQGETRWSHNASGSNRLLGDPTSQLKFKDVGTNVVEFGGQVTYAQRFFARAEYGFADIGGGRLTDDDYVSAAGATFYGTSTPGAQRISRTYSDINGHDMWYLNLDLGSKLVTSPNGKGSLSAFVGYQYWRQAHTATGVTQVQCASALFCNSAGTVSNSGQTVLTNTASWTSLRMGLEGEYEFLPRLSFRGKAAFIPYASLDNRDIHHLRTDLAQNPSIRITGTGVGVDADGTLSYRIVQQLFFDFGYRFWWMNVLDGQFQSYSRTGIVSTAPLNEFMSMRQGFTLGLRYAF